MAGPTTRVPVFISYAPADKALYARLEVHLQLLVRQGAIDPWHQGRVGPGEEWTAATTAQLGAARVILLLVSADYLATDPHWREMERALARHAAGEARVVPVILGPCDWHSAPFGTLRPLPEGGRPVTTWPNPEEAWADVVQGVRAALEQLGRARRAATAQGIRSELSALLSRLFSGSDLLRFLGEGRGAPDALGLPPAESVGKTELVAMAVDALIDHDLIDAAFFDRMLRERTYWHDDIHRVMAAWQGALARAGSKPGDAQRRGSVPNSPEPPRGPAPADTRTWGTMTARAALGAALRLDRSAQWATVIAMCHGSEHVFFLLYGHSRQSLGLFLDRIHYYLAEQSGRPHRVFRVPFRLGHSFATSGAEWESHLSFALAPGRRGTAADHLALAAQHQAVLLILGLRPIHSLTPEQQVGVRELICESLPRILDMARPANPVRILMAVDFDLPEESLEPMIDGWALEAERTGSLAYGALAEVKFPTWDEVESYLRDFRPRPTPEVVAMIKREFEAILQAGNSTFQQLAERLDRHLGDL
ncbi:toll/interleukin-1 receptor domain-containing protein [Sorangium sp. So ce861]|uniref:toll/interleukin-1 receptor domain-containing protein n=1 Tax=Sorangium sp. So ce861 TaxID=3133323 RepID=UPI003F5FBDDC